MAGSKNSVSLHAINARRAANAAQGELARRFQRFSMAEFEAQKRVKDMVEVLAGIAMDANAPLEIRRLCALDVIERADGKVVQKVQVQQMPVDETGTTLEHEAEAATAEARLLAETEQWISSGADPSTWPEHIRLRFGPETLSTTIDG
jgi:hypothetical protein